MNIAILGTGTVGRTLGSAFARGGHRVGLGSRSADNPTARAWAEEAGPPAHAGAFADVAEGADLLVNATAGVASVEAIASIPQDRLDGVVLLDVANPIEPDSGFPPRIAIGDTSLGETIQTRFPALRVVKGLNTLTADLMLRPDALPEPTSLFVCGDDASAKRTVVDLLASFGWRDVVDLGPIAAARGTELYLAFWLRTMAALGTGHFNIRVVRG